MGILLLVIPPTMLLFKAFWRRKLEAILNLEEINNVESEE